MVKVNTFSIMEMFTKANGLMTKRVVTDLRPFQAEIYLKENLKMVKEMDKANTFIIMEMFTKAGIKMVKEMVRDN